MRETMDFAAMGANLGRQLTGSMGAYDQSYSRMAQQLAQQGAFQSQANLNNEKANQLRQRGQFQTPEFAGKIAAGFAGLTEPQAAEIEGYMKRGNWGENPAYEDEAKQMSMAPTPKAQPSFATPETLNKYNVGRTAHLMNLGGTGDSNSQQMAETIAKLLGQGRIDTVIADPSKASALGKAMAASQGKALFHQGANGVMDQFTGAENLNDVGRSAAMENRAQANNANASAEHHIASRDLTKSKIGQPVVNPDGSVTTPADKINWKYDAGSDEFVAPPTPEFPNGRRSGNISKQNAAQSLEYVIGQFAADEKGESAEKGKRLIDITPQGGILGVKGYVGRVTDSQRVKRFDNLKEQLSTELRTLFRIPGEGALSDREQAQYGIQLPDVTNDATTNEAILRDVQARVKLRQDQSANPLKPKDTDNTAALRDAKAAIAAGADRAAVIKRLKEMGINGGAL